MKKSRKNRRKGECTCCGDTVVGIERHHIFPKVHFGRRGPLVDLCTHCHRKFEVYMQNLEGKTKSGKRFKRPQKWYRAVFFQFLGFYRTKNCLS